MKKTRPPRNAIIIVMAGLDPAIHVFCLQKQDVDARDKRGHDEGWFRGNGCKKAPVETGA